MSNQVKQIIRKTVLEMLGDSMSSGNIRKMAEKHAEKVHFVPVRYRIVGGILQGLNIKFGNFIEQLLRNIVEIDTGVKVMDDSGKKIKLFFTHETDALIDSYITERQLPNSPDDCSRMFSNLLDKILEIERGSTDEQRQGITKDVDGLFQTDDGLIVYTELKYNDDHDTGKFVDINRKFIKTWAGLAVRYQIQSKDELLPILYYFNATKRYGPIYTPSKNIMRGSQLFDKKKSKIKLNGLGSVFQLASLAFIGFAQQSVHLTCGILRHFRAFSSLQVFSAPKPNRVVEFVETHAPPVRPCVPQRGITQTTYKGVATMVLPDYWLTRPIANCDKKALNAFDELLNATLKIGGCPTIEYTLPMPKWQFLCHLADAHELALHGSGDGSIPLFEPRQSNDLNEFGNQKAVYAASDGLWAMFFAIVDRERVTSITNACVRLADETGTIHGPYYVFSVSQSALPSQPWRTGTVYLLPRSPFTTQPPMTFGPNQVHIAQLASFVPVQPLAKLTVTPADFPFLMQIRGHDDQRLQEYATALQTGAPWPSDT